MKVIIQIPAYNEEKTLGITLKALPRHIPGVDKVEWLVISDGSKDNTIETAIAHGVDHIVDLAHNRGLARAFMVGIEKCLTEGADIIVNTDADNQYNAEDIPKLITPILRKEADIVVGERPIFATQHFSLSKKLLQKLGSFITRIVSKTRIPDAPSGFRAINRHAAMRLNVFNDYTYTIETIIQAGWQGIKITSVPIRTNEDLRPSRLVKSISKYTRQTAFTMIRSLNTYRPLGFFLGAGAIPLFAGMLLCIRWVVFFMGDKPGSHLPSLIAAAILILLGIQMFIFGFIADLISVNRKLLEDIQLSNRQQKFDHFTSKEY